MNEMPAVHPSAEQLRAFGQGLLDDASMDQIAEHVAHCDDCCRQLGDVPEDSLLARLKNADTHAPPEETLAPVSVRPVPASQGTVPAALRDHPRYRVLKYIGRGGMGDVFQAEHRVMRKLVALKVIRPELLTNSKAVQRFQQEVQAAASLNHRNIVTATDAEQAEDVHFLVMEYVEGQSLDRVVEQRGPLPVLHACNYARQVALGLQHAHERELVHRDIKPHNLMLTRRGEIKILDFGLARLNRLAGAREADPSLTTHGATLGTPDYIAPEQIRDARAVDARADLYSLGGTLYFLLTGSVPFPADTAIEKMRLHLTAQPLPLDRFRSDVPAELTGLVQSLLAKEPADRPASARDVARLLEPFATRSARSATVAAPLASPAPAAAWGPAALPPAAGPPSAPVMLSAFAPQPAAGTVPETAPAAHPVEPELDLMSLPLEPAEAWPAAPVRQPAQRPVRPSGRPLFGLVAGARGRLAAGRRLLPAVTVIALAAVVLVAAANVRSWLSPPARPPLPTPTPVPDLAHLPDAGSSPAAATPTASGQVLIVLPAGRVWYPDYERVRTALQQAGMEVRVASSRLTPVPTLADIDQPGPEVVPELLLSEAMIEQFQGIVLIGYEIGEFLPGNPQGDLMKRVVDQAVRGGATVGSICAANAILSRHGYLAGRPAAASQWAVQAGAQDSEADWRANSVQCSGPFVTASSDAQAREFARLLVQRMSAAYP